MKDNSFPKIEINLTGANYGSSISINGMEIPDVTNIFVCAEVGQPTLVSIEMYGEVSVTGESGVLLSVDTPFEYSKGTHCLRCKKSIIYGAFASLAGMTDIPLCNSCIEQYRQENVKIALDSFIEDKSVIHSCSYCGVNLEPEQIVLVTRLDGTASRTVCRRCEDILLRDGWIKVL